MVHMFNHYLLPLKKSLESIIRSYNKKVITAFKQQLRTEFRLAWAQKLSIE